MGMGFPQEFLVVRGEVDHHETAAGAQDACRLADGAAAIVEEVQHLVDDHRVIGVARQGERINVAGAHRTVANAGAVERGAGEIEHLGAGIDAEAALDLGREKFQHPAGAGAKIEEGAQRTAGKRLADRPLHPLLRHVEGAQPVPVRGVAAEEGLRLGRPLGPDLGETVAIAGEDRISRIDEGGERIDGAGAWPLPRGAEEGPGAFLDALDQPGFEQELQMARDARLRLAEDVDHVRHRQLRFDQQGDEAQARRLAHRAKDRDGVVEIIAGRDGAAGGGGGGCHDEHSHIKISLCPFAIERKSQGVAFSRDTAFCSVFVLERGRPAASFHPCRALPPRRVPILIPS